MITLVTLTNKFRENGSKNCCTYAGLTIYRTVSSFKYKKPIYVFLSDMNTPKIGLLRFNLHGCITLFFARYSHLNQETPKRNTHIMIAKCHCLSIKQTHVDCRWWFSLQKKGDALVIQRHQWLDKCTLICKKQLWPVNKFLISFTNPQLLTIECIEKGV